MKNKVFTNKVNFEINKEELDSKYKLFHLQSNRKNTNENILSQMAKNNALMKKVKASLFVDKYNAYVLSDEDVYSSTRLSQSIICDTESIFEADETVLLNLILYLHNAENDFHKEPISNINGSLYLYIPELNKAKEMCALKLRFYADNGTYLASDLQTFVKCEKLIPTDKRLQQAKYKLSVNNTLCRTDDCTDAYVMGSISKKKHNNINDFIVADDRFHSCRVYSYYVVYDIMYNSVFIDKFDFIAEEYEMVKDEYAKNNRPHMTAHEINIINTTTDKTMSDTLVQKIQTIATKHSLNILDIKCSNTIHNVPANIEQRNMIILEDSDVKNQETSKEHHHPDLLKQCIAKKTINSETAITNALWQLQIKSDLKKAKISTSKMCDTACFKKITAISYYPNDISENDVLETKAGIYTISIDADGNMLDTFYNPRISSIEKLSIEVYDKCRTTDCKQQGLHFIIIDGKVFENTNTGIRTIPNIKKMYNRMNTDDNFYEHISYFIDILIELNNKNKNAKMKKEIEDIQNIFNDKNEIIDARTFIDTIKPVAPNNSKRIVRYFYDNKIYHYRKFGQGKETIQAFYPCYESGYRIAGDEFVYFSQQGNPGDSMKNVISKANIVYTLQNLNGEDITENEKNIFLWLIYVTFVRYQNYTTKPFLFKYIKELIETQREREVLKQS